MASAKETKSNPVPISVALHCMPSCSAWHSFAVILPVSRIPYLCESGEPPPALPVPTVTEERSSRDATELCAL